MRDARRLLPWESLEILQSLSFTLDPREIVRLLGYVPGRRPPSKPVLSRIEEMTGESHGLVEARGCYAITRLAQSPSAGPFRGAERIAYSVCTIGPKLERRVAQLAAKGESLRALILDAIGSASVEAVADVVNAAICKRVGQTDAYTNRRISPGYRGWPIQAQAEIFALLPSRISGVTLTPTWFMTPRKSISAAVSIGRNVSHSKYVAICAHCNLRDCAFRRRPDQEPLDPDPAHG
jgi:hypothetical protein